MKPKCSREGWYTRDRVMEEGSLDRKKICLPMAKGVHQLENNPKRTQTV